MTDEGPERKQSKSMKSHSAYLFVVALLFFISFVKPSKSTSIALTVKLLLSALMDCTWTFSTGGKGHKRYLNRDTYDYS